jgi:hypothetical protein
VDEVDDGAAAKGVQEIPRGAPKSQAEADERKATLEPIAVTIEEPGGKESGKPQTQERGSCVTMAVPDPGVRNTVKAEEGAEGQEPVAGKVLREALAPLVEEQEEPA